MWEQPHYHTAIGMIMSTNVRKDDISASMIPNLAWSASLLLPELLDQRV
jgi:hypothetical protein